MSSISPSFPLSPAVERICIDVTETVMKSEWTGIGRVIRRLAGELEILARPGGPAICLVAAIDGQFHALNDAGVQRLKVRTAVPGSGGQGRLASLAAAVLGLVPPAYVAIQSAYKQRKFRGVLLPLLHDAPVQFGPGDVILLLDTYWGGMSSISAAGRARSAGATVISAIYDLIPITHPQFMTPLVSLAFPYQLLRAIRVSDGALAISRQSALGLRTFLGTRHPALPIHWFHLGNDAAKATAPRHPSQGCFGYTMVGTVEPRKGHDLVLDAFESLWAAGSSSRLTIVGKMGWGSPDMQLRLEGHPEAGKRLIVRHDVSDEELAGIFQGTDAVIQASKVEGFGLPIVEALANDIPVIASDIPVFREIGGDTILYFDADSSVSLVSAIAKFEAYPDEYREHARGFEWPSWRDSAARVLDRVGEIAARRDMKRQPG